MRCLLIAMAVFVSTVQAADLPFGADSLPFLERNAELVLVAKSFERLDDSPPKVTLYRIVPEKVLKGKAAEEALTVMIPKGLDDSELPNVAGSLVFLSDPVTDKERAQWQLGGEQPIRMVVSGRYGIVALNDKQRAESIIRYVTADEGSRLIWAERNVESADPLLHRSALMEATLSVNNPKMGDDAQKKSLEVLAKGLNSENVTPQNKLVGIYGLSISNSPDALKPLQEAATNPEFRKQVRLTALEAVGSVPGGMEALQELMKSDDALIQPAATRLMERFKRPEREAISDDQVAKLREQLKSENGRLVREALSEISGYKHNEIVGNLVAQVISNEGSKLQTRIKAVETLRDFNDAEAASALQKLAMDSKQDMLLRRTAILSLSSMESGISVAALKKLSEELPEKELKEYAAGLVLE